MGESTFAVGTEQRVAQTITAGENGRLLGVFLDVGCLTGRLRIEIRDVVGDLPGDMMLARSTFRAEEVTPEVDGVFQYFRTNGPKLVLGDRFSIVLSNPGGLCVISQGPEGNPYPGGNGFRGGPMDPPEWTPADLFGRLDFPFMTVVHKQR